MIKVYAGGALSSGNHIRVYENGILTLSVYNGTDFRQVNGIQSDASGAMYVGSNSSSSITTRKLDAAGSEIWAVTHGANVSCIAVDSSGNVYTGGSRTSSLTTRKYDSSGSLQWSVDHGNTVRGIAVDSSGNVYTTGTRTSNLTTRKYDSSGSLIWSIDHGASCTCIAVDSSGNVYTGGGVVSSVLTTRKYDTDGNLIWTAAHYATVNGIAVDSSGNVYTVGNRTSSITTRKYDSSGTEQWTADHGDHAFCVAVADGGTIYTGGRSISSVTTREYAADGTPGWTADHGADVYGIATITVASTQSLPPGLALAFALSPPWRSQPGLALALALGLPTTAITPLTPGLPIAFALAAPKSVWTWTGAGGVVFYRLYLTGGTGTIELPLASVQARRYADSLWLSVVIPGITPAMVASIEARSAGTLIVNQGIRLTSGAELAESWLTAPLTVIRMDQGGHSASLVLDGRATAVNSHVKTRVLSGVRERRYTQQGWQTISAIDRALDIGDTADAGEGVLLMARKIGYQIDAQRAVMTVSEAG